MTTAEAEAIHNLAKTYAHAIHAGRKLVDLHGNLTLPAKTREACAEALREALAVLEKAVEQSGRKA